MQESRNAIALFVKKMRKLSFRFPERLVADICPNDHDVYFERGELEQVFKIGK